MQYLTFHVGDREFAVDLARVREIVNPPPITRVPGMPAALLGLVGLRGDPTAVVDAGLRLAGRRTVPGGRTPLIVLTFRRDDRASEVALLVEAAGRRLEVEALLPWDAGLARIAGADACAGFADVEGSLVIVLDVDRLLAFERVAAASALALPASRPAAEAKRSIAAPIGAADRAAGSLPGAIGDRAASAAAVGATVARASRSEPPGPATPPAAGTPSAAGVPSPSAPRLPGHPLRPPAPASRPRTVTPHATPPARPAQARIQPAGSLTPPPPAANWEPFAPDPLPIVRGARPSPSSPPAPGLAERARPPRPEPSVPATGASREQRGWAIPAAAVGAVALLALFLLAFLRPDGPSAGSAPAPTADRAPSEVRAEPPRYPPPTAAFDPIPALAPRVAQEPARSEALPSTPTPGAASAEVAPAPAPIPTRRPLPPSMVVTPDTPPCEIHVVRRGDTLWDISAERLGNPYRWPRLFGENRGHILDPDVIEVDDRIRIPGACRPPGGE